MWSFGPLIWSYHPPRCWQLLWSASPTLCSFLLMPRLWGQAGLDGPGVVRCLDSKPLVPKQLASSFWSGGGFNFRETEPVRLYRILPGRHFWRLVPLEFIPRGPNLVPFLVMCKMMAFWAVFSGFGPLFYILWGSRYSLLL